MLLGQPPAILPPQPSPEQKANLSALARETDVAREVMRHETGAPDLETWARHLPKSIMRPEFRSIMAPFSDCVRRHIREHTGIAEINTFSKARELASIFGSRCSVETVRQEAITYLLRAEPESSRDTASRTVDETLRVTQIFQAIGVLSRAFDRE